MTEELYDEVETKAAFESLRSLSGGFPKPFLILGGWAVFLTVDGPYRREHGASYLGSRDVDVCFHVEKWWDVSRLRGCPFAGAVEAAKRSGYVPMGSFRFCKFVRRGTGEVVTEEQSRAVPLMTCITCSST